MDTAFINRVGITSRVGIRRVQLLSAEDQTVAAASWRRSRSRRAATIENAGGNELLQVTGVRMQFSRQGSFRFDRFDGFEAWAGQRFDRARWRMFGGVQLYRWLNLNGQYFFGDAVFYDPVDPYQGTADDGGFGVTLQPSGRLSQGFDYRRVSFDKRRPASTSTTSICIYSRTTYQFSRQFFIRGIAQYDSSRYPRAHRLSRLVRVASGNGRLCRVRVAHRAARLPRWPVDHR